MSYVLNDRRFPYWSDTFGCQVNDRHHLALLEKQHGVVQATEFDLDRAVRKVRAENEDIKVKSEQQDLMYEEAPQYAHFRELRARGFFTQHLPGPLRERAEASIKRKRR